MSVQRVTVASLAMLGLGAVVTGTALVKAAGFSALFSEFSLLAFSPYAVFFGVCFFAGSSRARAIATLVVCTLATGCAIFLYADLIFLNPGSMSGLVFFLVPLYQLPAAILLLVVVFFACFRSRGRASA